MDSFDFISKLLDGRVVLGNKEEVLPNLYIIPVYRVKISFLNLSTDVKSNVGDGSQGSINVTPICLLQIKDYDIKIINLSEDSKKDGLDNIIPNILSNLDVNGILKNIKIDV